LADFQQYTRLRMSRNSIDKGLECCAAKEAQHISNIPISGVTLSLQTSSRSASP
jgi:hypothetical protein